MYNPDHEYVYIFVRKDLTPEQICVQSSHAALETSRHHVPIEKQHPSIVILQVANEEELNSVSVYLNENGIQSKEFREAFYNDSLTAIGTEIISGERRALLKDFKLLTLRE